MADRTVIEIGPRGGRIVGHHAGHGGKPVAEYEGHHVGGALRPSQPRLFDSPRTLTLKPPEERERRPAAREAQPDLFGPSRTIALRAPAAAQDRRPARPAKPLPWTSKPAESEPAEPPVDVAIRRPEEIAARDQSAESSAAAAKLQQQTAERSGKPAQKTIADVLAEKDDMVTQVTWSKELGAAPRPGEVLTDTAGREWKVKSHAVVRQWWNPDSPAKVGVIFEPSQQKAPRSTPTPRPKKEKAPESPHALPPGESRWHGGIKATRDGRSVNLTGATYPVKDSLAALGAKWNGEHRAWRLSHDKYTEHHNRIQKLGEKAHDSAAAEKRERTGNPTRPPAGSGGSSGSGRPSDAQLDYAMKLISRISKEDWFDVSIGDGNPKPTRAEVAQWSAREVSALIDELKESMPEPFRGYGSRGAYKDLSGFDRLTAQIAERAA